MKRVFLLLAFPVVCLAADSVVSDTLLNLSGGPATCTLTITGQTVTSEGRRIITSRKSVVANPTFTVTLVPNDTSSPANSFYHVDYSCGSNRTFAETWRVPTSVTPLSISAVVINTPPPGPGLMFNPSQLTSGGAGTGQVLTWLGTFWGPATGSGGITGPGSSTVGNVPQFANSFGNSFTNGLGVVTSVGTPGADTNLATEAAVRAAIVSSTSGVSGPGTTVMGYLPTWANLIGSSLGPGLPVSVTPGANAVPESDTNGRIAAGWMPAFSADIQTTAGSTAATVRGINGTILSSLASGILLNTTGTGVPSIAGSADILAACPSCVTTAGTTDGQLIKGAGAQGLQAADLSGDALTTGTTIVTNTGVNGVQFSGLATGLLKNTTGTGVPSIAVSADILAACPTCLTAIVNLPAGQLVAGAGLKTAQAANLSGDAFTSGTTAVTNTGLNGVQLGTLATGLLKNTTGTGVPSIAAAGTDYVDITTGVQNNQANTYTSGLQHMGLADLVLPSHAADPGTCSAGQIEFNSVGTVAKLCTAANTWTAIGVSSGTVTGPGSSTNLFVPQWSGTGGTALGTGLGVVTVVGSPGLDTNLATEAAVRAAIVAGTAGVTGAGTTVVGFVPTWGNVVGTSLSAGLAVSATPGASTILESDGGGKLAAGWLPVPTASTLGGVQSLAAVSHKWINTISTSGVAAATQPACSDISDAAASCATDTTVATNLTSGTLPAARLPAAAVQTGQANTYTTGLQSMALADLLLPSHAADPATCTAGQLEFNSTTALGKLCLTTNAWTRVGSVSSVTVPAIPSWLTATVATGTTTPAISITATAAQTANQFIATPNGSTGTFAPRAIVAADIPVLTGTQLPAFTGDVTKASGSAATTVTALNNISLAGLATGLLKNTTGTGVPSIAVSADILAACPTCTTTTTGLGSAGAVPVSNASPDLKATGVTIDGSNNLTANSFTSSNAGPTLWQFKEGTAPSSPSGVYTEALYQDTDHHLKVKKTDGTVFDLEAVAASGDTSSTVSSSIDNQVTAFSGTTGKLVKPVVGTSMTAAQFDQTFAGPAEHRLLNSTGSHGVAIAVGTNLPFVEFSDDLIFLSRSYASVGDGNGPGVLRLVAGTANANSLRIAGGVTGVNPKISVEGSDTNAGIEFATKGTGTFKFNSMSGLLTTTAGVLSTIVGTASDCVKVDGSSGPCSAAAVPHPFISTFSCSATPTSILAANHSQGTHPIVKLVDATGTHADANITRSSTGDITVTCPGTGSVTLTARINGESTGDQPTVEATLASSSTWIIPRDVHDIGSTDVEAQVWDSSTPHKLMEANTMTVDPTTFTITLNFSQAVSGTAVIAHR
jgi:hypothetical protein